MFSLQEYQHVHVLWFKKRSFTLVWKPNPPLRSVRCAHLLARADAASALHTRRFCAASALRCETRLYWSARAESASLHVISEIFLLLQCAAAGSVRCMKSSADHALAQVRPRQIFTRTLSKNGRSIEHCLSEQPGLPYHLSSATNWSPPCHTELRQ